MTWSRDSNSDLSVIQPVASRYSGFTIVDQWRLKLFYSNMNQGPALVETLNVGFEVLSAVVMKCTIFWDTTPSNSFKFDRGFGGDIFF
jgi:hypothetical protein